MKTFTRKRTLDEIRAICAEKGWPLKTDLYDRGDSDGVSVRFRFDQPSLVTGMAVISLVTGKIVGQMTHGMACGTTFSSDQARHEGQPWFDALLDLALTNDPPAGDPPSGTPADYKTLYEHFWKGIVEKDGVLDMDAVMRELFDFHALMYNAAIVYCHVTGNRISKVNTDPDAVCAVADDIVSEAVREALREQAQIEGPPGDLPPPRTTPADPDRERL